ncbi:MAG: DUF4491 family protein [Bacteroidales bacterium]|nr:DUF4491 family protein [Bacteroidales bacterium]
MNFEGIILGLATFLLIGVSHPIVIKSEYYFGVKCWFRRRTDNRQQITADR